MSAMRIVVLASLALRPLALGRRRPASAQTYPSKPIHIIVPTPPGGITDTLARALAQRLTESWGQQVIVENRPAGAGHIGMDFVAKSAPDGYTLMVTPDAAFVVNPHLYSKLPYDPIARLHPDQRSRHQPAGAGGASVGAGQYVRRADRLAKTKPGELNYGTFGIGTSGHLNIVLLESLTGAKFTPVHYRGAAPAITDLLGGHIQMMIVAIGLLRQHIAGRQAQGARLRQSAAPAAISRRADAVAKAAAGLRGRLLVRPRRAQGHAARDRREAQRRDAEDLRRPGVPRKFLRAGRHLLDRKPAGAVRRAHARRPRQMGQGDQGRRTSRWSSALHFASRVFAIAARSTSSAGSSSPSTSRKANARSGFGPSLGRRVRNVSRISPPSCERCMAISVSSG